MPPAAQAPAPPPLCCRACGRVLAEQRHGGLRLAGCGVIRDAVRLHCTGCGAWQRWRPGGKCDGRGEGGNGR